MKQQSYESTVLLQQWVILQPTEYDGGWHKMDSFVLKQRNKRDINQQLRIWDKGALEWIIAAHNVCRRCLNDRIDILKISFRISIQEDGLVDGKNSQDFKSFNQNIFWRFYTNSCLMNYSAQAY